MEKNEFKTLPKFESEDDEREFWATHETSDYVDWSKAIVVNGKEAFPNLMPTEDFLEFKMPIDDMKDLDSLAQKQHVTRDVLVRNVLQEWLQRQHGRARA